MTGTEPSAVFRGVSTLFRIGAIGGLTDRQLLERFAAGRDDAAVAEAAFAVLVERHGALVWGVCRRILQDPHEAADAFQATFLVLVRRAGSVQVDDSLGRWLYGVSRRVATRARKRAARRPVPADVEVAVAAAPDRSELRAVLDEEIGRLPERYRAAVVLCDLGGLSHEEAAARLACAVGTIGSRVARGRERLRSRLARRGLAPSAGALAAALAAEAEAAGPAIPAPLAESTVRAMLASAGGSGQVAGVVSATVFTLAKGVGNPMLLSHWKWVAAALVTAGITAGGSLVHALQPSDKGEANVRVEPGNPPPGDAPRGRGETPRPRTTTYQEDSRQLRHELDLLGVQLEKRSAEFLRARAELDLASALLAAHLKLHQRGMISGEDIRKDETNVKVAEAALEVAAANIKEVKLRMTRLDRLRDDPVQFRQWIDRERTLGAAAPDIPLDELEVQLLREKAELAKAKAELEMARANAANQERLNTKRPGLVSQEELRKSEAAAKVAEAEVGIAQADVHEAEIRLGAAKGADDRREPAGVQAAPGDPARAYEALESRMRGLERKLDRILDALDAKAPKPSR